MRMYRRRKRIQDRKRQWGVLTVWEGQRGVFLYSLKRTEGGRKTKRKCTLDRLRGGGGEDEKRKEEERNKWPREEWASMYGDSRMNLSGKDIRDILNSELSDYEKEQAPGMIDKNNAHQWLMDRMHRKVPGFLVIINTGDEEHWEKDGHWVLGQVQEEKRTITIWNPLMQSVVERSEVAQVLGMGKYKVEVKAVGRQKDGWTCGYHVIKWVIEYMKNEGKDNKHWCPKLDYDLRELVEFCADNVENMSLVMQWYGIVNKLEGKRIREERIREERTKDKRKRETWSDVVRKTREGTEEEEWTVGMESKQKSRKQEKEQQPKVRLQAKREATERVTEGSEKKRKRKKDQIKGEEGKVKAARR